MLSSSPNTNDSEKDGREKNRTGGGREGRKSAESHSAVRLSFILLSEHQKRRQGLRERGRGREGKEKVGGKEGKRWGWGEQGHEETSGGGRESRGKARLEDRAGRIYYPSFVRRQAQT